MPDPNDTVAGKFLKIEVPDYDHAGRGSYLRLGVSDPGEAAVAPTAEAPAVAQLKHLGTDLAVLAAVRGLDHSGGEDHIWESNFDNGPVIFQDDARDWGGHTNHLTPAARSAETAKLFTRGGWRDHSDGNRISTTRGDKIEVIRGNYKLLVLGRQGSLDSDANLSPGEGSGFDFSGGVSRGLGANLAEVDTTEVRYDDEGFWTTTKTHNGRVYDRFTGEQHSYFRGTAQSSEVGNEDDASECPDITEKTWAARIESYTGSFKRPVLVMRDETFAVEMLSLTNAVNISTATHAVAIVENVKSDNVTRLENYGGVQSMTNIGISNIATTVVGGLSTETFSAAAVLNQTNVTTTLQENVNATSITNVTTGGSLLDAKILAGAELDVVMVPQAVSLTMTMLTDLFVGAVTALKAGVFTDIGVGSFTDIKAGAKIGITAGISTEIVIPGIKKVGTSYTVTSPKVSLGNTVE
ncbi:MAG: hypothetical protein JNK72_17435 [Myxococcales bacterium]|nr:hypothetical protein [Myxococcales bacterium]